MWNLYCNYIVGGKNSGLIDILPKCNSIAWTSDSETLATTLTFNTLYDLAEGKTHLVLKKDNKQVYTGVVIEKINTRFVGGYTTMDYAFYLNQNKILIQFNNITAKQAIQQLCGKFGIKTMITTLNTKIKQIYKDSSVTDIIKDILTQCRNEIGDEYIFEMQGDVLYIDKLKNMKADCTLLFGKDYSITRNIENLKNRIIVISDTEKSTRILQDIKDPSSISTYGQLTEIINVDKKDIAQAKNIGRNNLMLLNKTKKELTIPTVAVKGGENVKANRMIQLSIPQYGINGLYRVKSASHTLSNNIHRIDLTIDFS